MPNATTPPALIECFRTGLQIDISGTQVNFTEADLQAIADVYDPALHEAPLVVGHPKLDSPAYGGARRFLVQGQILCAEPQDVEVQFAEMVNERRFPRVSLSLYTPDAPSNPKPGHWYPKHIGFLGGKAPAIKGLKSVQFSEADEGVLCFGDYTEGALIGMFRRMRDFLLTQFGQETADKVLPPQELDWATQEHAADQVRESIKASGEGATPAFAEGEQPGAGDDVMSQLEKAALQAQVDAANKKAADAEAALTARDQADAKAKINAEAVAFAEDMVGKAILPRERAAGVVAIYERLATPTSDGTVLQFGEGDAVKTAVQEFKDLVALGKPAVAFGEHANKRGDGGLHEGDELAQFAECSDPARLQLARDANAYQRAAEAKGRPVDYLTAVKAVQSNRQA